MKTSKFTFINQSNYGRNSWWTYLVLIVASVVALIGSGQFMNKAIVPIMKSKGLIESFGKENITFSIIALVFTALMLVLIFLHKKLHYRPFHSLINALPAVKFRTSLFLKGTLQWGIILFCSMLLFEWPLFENFLNTFDISNFIVVLAITIVAFFVQTLWEELIFRGYLLQNLSRKIKTKWISYSIVSLLFAFAHLGYGIQNFVFSFIFSVVAILIVVKDNGIERASGVHFINNLLLSVFFIDLNETVTASFSWEFDIAEGMENLLAFAILLVVVGIIKLPKKKSVVTNVVTSGSEVSQ